MENTNTEKNRDEKEPELKMPGKNLERLFILENNQKTGKTNYTEGQAKGILNVTTAMLRGCT
jgi:hypothetical protein